MEWLLVIHSLTWSSCFRLIILWGRFKRPHPIHIYVILMKSKVEYVKSHNFRIYTESTLPPFYRLELTVLVIN